MKSFKKGEIELDEKSAATKAKSELIEGLRELANHCFESASTIETQSRMLNEKMKFLISTGEMNMSFSHMLGSVNGLTIAVVRVLQKVNKTCSAMLEETHPDQVEVPLAPEEPAGMN